MSGALILVATPIGNLGDVSMRALETLREADRILCEDTRRTRALLSALEIPGAGRLSSLHEHNELGRIEQVATWVASGEVVAVVSDAGTPAISDPGGRLVASLVERGLEVRAVPGPSAVITALVVSGLPIDRFCMEGFLPRRGAARSERVAALGSEERVSVIFESPKRLAATLAELRDALGAERTVSISRELTKRHEETWRGALAEAAAHFEGRDVLGEVVIVLGGALAAPPQAEVDDEQIRAGLAAALSAGVSRRDAAAEVAADLGVPRRRVYELASTMEAPTTEP